jgi:hypothetical protein
VSVKSARLEKTGSVYLSTDVPDYSGRALEMSGPLLGYTAASGHPEVLTLTDAGLLTFVPVLGRTFTSADRLRIACPIWRGAGLARPVTARIELIDGDGGTALASSTELAPDASAIDATLSLEGVSRGAYRLRVHATDGTATAEREVGIAIR